MFHYFEDGKMSIKMRKPSKKTYLLASWEGLYLFVGYKDGKGCQEQDDGTIICIFKDKDGQTWQKAKWDLQIYHAVFSQSMRTQIFYVGNGYTCDLKGGLK